LSVRVLKVLASDYAILRNDLQLLPSSCQIISFWFS